MKVDIVTIKGKKTGESAELPADIFEAPVNVDLMHQAYMRQLANARAGTHSTKTRSEVSGGGSKPWRQKGTGRARAGTLRSPIFRTGGVTFAARPRNYEQKVNRKMYRGALRSILSELVRQDRLVIVDAFGVDAPRTKELVGKLNDLGVTDALVVTQQFDENLMMASRNLYHVGVTSVTEVGPVSLVGFDKVIMTSGALKALEERLA